MRNAECGISSDGAHSAFRIPHSAFREPGWSFWLPWPSGRPSPLLAASFEKNQIDHPGPTIRIYRTGYTSPKSAADVHAGHPLDALFNEQGPNGGAVRLLGADYPPTATVGSPLPLTLYWQAQS